MRTLIAIVGIGCFCGCAKIASVQDVTAPQAIALSTDAPRVQAFSAEIVGWLDGEATVRFYDPIDAKTGVPLDAREATKRGGEVQWEEGPAVLKGNIAYTLARRDWYSTNIVFHYEPKNVKGGQLKVRYRFYDY